MKQLIAIIATLATATAFAQAPAAKKEEAKPAAAKPAEAKKDSKK